MLQKLSPRDHFGLEVNFFFGFSHISSDFEYFLIFQNFLFFPGKFPENHLSWHVVFGAPNILRLASSAGSERARVQEEA